MEAFSADVDMADARRLEDLSAMLALLARLHDREPDRALIAGLQDTDTQEWIGGLVTGEPAQGAVEAFIAAVNDIRLSGDSAIWDILAAEYADIYLTYAYRVSPNGSVWLTEDGLEHQEPMFAARRWYQRYGLQVPDWRMRSDDHLVHELQFVVHLCTCGTDDAASDAARFLDDNVLGWLADFARLVGERTRVPFFASAARLTHVAVEELRDLLERTTGINRPQEADEKDAGRRRTRKRGRTVYNLYNAEQDRPFLPGAGKGW